MTPAKFRAIRHSLGLSLSDMAQVVGVTPRQVRRLEEPPGKSSHRPVGGPMEKLVKILAGEYGQTLPEILRNLRL